MREIIGFIRYSWRSWELWQKLILLSVALNIISVALPNPWATYMGVAALSIVAGMIITWWVTSMLIPKWQAYKQHRNELLTTIRDSHK